MKPRRSVGLVVSVVEMTIPRLVSGDVPGSIGYIVSEMHFGAPYPDLENIDLSHKSGDIIALR